MIDRHVTSNSTRITKWKTPLARRLIACCAGPFVSRLICQLKTLAKYLPSCRYSRFAGWTRLSLSPEGNIRVSASHLLPTDAVVMEMSVNPYLSHDTLLLYVDSVLTVHPPNTLHITGVKVKIDKKTATL